MTDISLNGAPFTIDDGTTVADLVADRVGGGSDARRGVAVAVDGEVVPRSQWDATVLPADSKVEIVTAVQGG